MSTTSHFMCAHVRIALVAITSLALTCSFSSTVLAQSSIYASGPYLARLSQRGVVVRVETETPERLTLTVEPGKHRVEDPAPSAGVHTLSIDGLDPKTTYHYAVATNRGGKEEGLFTTAPTDDDRGDIRFALYGDDRGGITTHAMIAKRVGDEPIDFIINTGDVVADGRIASQWEGFFAIEGKLLRDHCLFTAIGNHELVQENGASFLRYFGTDEQQQKHVFYNTFRWGFARFFVVNGEAFLAEDRTWLERELQKSDTEANLLWRIVLVHWGPFASGPHGDNEKLQGAEVPKLMREHHVDFVLAGHDHIYERGASDGLRYVVSGGAGAPLYPIKRPRATARKLESAYHYVIFELGADKGELVAKRVDGSIIEEIGFTKSNLWNDDGPTIAPANSVASLSTKPPNAPAPTPPPDDDEDEKNKPAGRGAYVVVGLVLVAAASLYFNHRRTKSRPKKEKPPADPPPED